MSTNRFAHRRHPCGWILLSLFCLPAIAQGQEPGVLPSQDDLCDQIVDAWRKRQAAVKTLQATWLETVINSVDEEPNQLATPEVGLVTFSLGKQKEMSIESAPFEGDVGVSSRKVTDLSVFNGKRNFNFTSFVKHGDDEGWPIGIVWDADVSDEAHNVQIRPWLLHVRCFAAPVPNFSREHLRVVATDVLLKHRRCAVVEHRPANQPQVGIYFVDVERDCSILRYHERVNERVTFRLNVDYKADPKLGWIPASWNGEFENGRFAVSGVLLDCKLNAELSASTFNVDFPRGTLVFDRDEGHRSLWLGNGKRREITSAESAAGFRYKDLFTTKAGELAPRAVKRAEDKPVD